MSQHSILRAKFTDIWRQVFDLDTVDPTMDLFALGATSLQIIRLINRIEASFGVRLSPRTVFREPSFQEIFEMTLNTLSANANSQ